MKKKIALKSNKNIFDVNYILNFDFQHNSKVKN